MDTYSSGEELIIKTRKPYTITKQRERWTEEEHSRFLEALKLYGRAWQRIEEHIGTKTAVQIRSHAQKFFSKLEKEAHAKGIPVGQTLDIDIPPPRPKRKPSNPYPRKTSVSGTTLHAGAKDGQIASATSVHCKQALDLEKEPLPEYNGDEKPSDENENQGDNCSQVLTLHQEAHCSSVSSVNKTSTPATVALRNSRSFREFVSPLKQDNGTSKASNIENSCLLQDKSIQGAEEGMNDSLPTDDMQGIQNYPRHVPVHVLERNLGTTPPPDLPYHNSIFHATRGVHEHSSLFTNPVASSATEHQSNVPRSAHQTFPTFHPPFNPVRHSEDDYQSFFHFSSTFSSLIVSTLLQNPAAHTAASFAASFWPYANVEASANSPTATQGGFPARQANSAPSMAAIAAATVAAATAWWAAHGLLPLCAPLHASFTCSPPSATAVPSIDNGQAPAAKAERKENILQNPSLQDQQLDAEHSEALQAQHSASKSPISSSSDSEESGGTKQNAVSEAADHEKATAVTAEILDSNKTKSRKQVDRSSCGSNTTSSSEIERDDLEKKEKDNEELKEANLLANESSNRRNRSSSNTSDSWKSVSEEGRLAFQALFSREVLPQSFSPPHDLKSKGHQKEEDKQEEKQTTDEKGGDTSAFDLNSKSSDHQGVAKNALSKVENNCEESLLTIGLGHAKLKSRKTGFKPYKRCSMEAKENRLVNATSQGDEKGPKRMRLEGEAST